MSGEEDTGSGDGGSGLGSRGLGQVPETRKMYWRSSSWSSSRSSLPPLHTDNDKDGVDLNGINGGQSRRFPAPLTPRSQQNCKARSCLPPLQPLAISRRSLDEWPKAGSDDVGEWPVPITPGGRDLNKNGERLKLDLSTIQRNSDKNGGLVKREKIAFFDKECSKVAEHIYLGGDAVAKDRDILKQNGITHILNCVGFVCPEYFKADFVYRTLWLQDSPSEDITSILYDVFDYFEDVREKSGRVFVHCCQGVSRSTSLVIAYLMWREGQSFDDAFQYVKAARGIADPNMGFACQLLQCQKRVHAFPLSPSSLLRMYRIAPHSPYDPLHLVPKMLNDPSAHALDSRGAFIIHIPSSIYVWIGKKCEAIMEKDARGAVCQIVRYEKVQGPIIMVKEGEEPAYFWDAFSNLLPLMDKSGNGVDAVGSSIKIFPGERKVDSYDIDLDIFQKAIKGGFVPPFPSSETENETHLPARESSWSVLRRKFASGNMKDFVLASKLALSRVYPDSMLIVGADNSVNKSLHSSANLLSSTSPSPVSLTSPSSSSPPYLSPDSISSDSSISSKYFSDSPTVSPAALPCSHSLSSNLSSISNFSLPSKISPKSITKTSEYIDVNFTSGLRSKSAFSPSKRSPLSIAERRGSLTKCLTLPVRTSDSGTKDVPSSYPDSQHDCINRNISNCICEPQKIKNFLEPKRERDSNQECDLQESSCGVANVESCDEQAAFIKTSDEPCRNHPLGKRSCGFTGFLAGGSACCNPTQPLIIRWPSLEKFVKLGAGGLDSESAFIFLTPSPDLGKIEDVTLYFWVGKSFNHGKSKIQLGSNGKLDDLEEIDWNQVVSDVRAQMGLPEDTDIKIVKEDKEPVEFLALLCSL
ncbi:protein-tyrosine-phosphatase MKP1-like [Actinidia eriantha]|uniref:protein-tyrosine-phosphatase MKP1-like n=1 Tax=Actinidia eriantha TaxID=165200 RepID=UPI00258C070C|nr:protein-tyrosine-phosphatase MKP1-like [Actinidia eriantha]XP_057476759.1 protein-tyrosine-phosphatase MKP1-like [Actinidia eriantha]XP_057476760.1 protein-tyrosine-phosphatase MKP1-like [Actinidia eriantha]XP_057476761.1 protein-tyrosine-phosphatase MKP1-like [Actinidia eriantha]XP_057476762.1 protein-tyrosine-phosphatase MKP1-like [Actinidia eriantha]